MAFDAAVTKNQIYKMDILDIGNTGMGIGKINGFTVFVEGALPGEEIEVKIVKVKKSYAFGKMLRIIAPSPWRMKPVCSKFGKCGGCQLMHFEYKKQLEYKAKKVKDCLERIGGVKDVPFLPPVGMENPSFYRNKAQYPVGGEGGDVKIGFYSLRSHTIIDNDSCYIQNKRNEEIVGAVREYILENHIPVYDELSQKGIIRHILTRVGYATGEIMVCIVVNAKKLPKQDKLIEKLRKIENMTSIVLNINEKKTNVILGEKIDAVSYTHLKIGRGGEKNG